MKKILLIVVDAFASRVLMPALANGKLPNILVLDTIGSLNPECTAIFPSLTPAATSSIVTGRYPRDHSVLGFHWYDLENDQVIYYGDDFWVIWNEGFKDFFQDFLYKLNHCHLQAETLFQIIERSGLKTASLNYLIYRGNVKHTAKVPFWLSIIPGVPFSEDIYGPSLLYFGDLVDTEIKPTGDSLSKTGGPFHRFGFDDENTANLLIQLAEQKALPAFTLAYFPDNDYRSHEKGPDASLATLKQVDSNLGDLFTALGGVEQALKEYCIILTGDHSQSDMVADEAVAGIRLDEILADFVIAPPGEPWAEDDDLVICPDMRSAQIYFRNLDAAQLEQVVGHLLKDPRVDQVLWRYKHVETGDEKGYHVATSDRGRLHFWPDGDGSHTAVDQYGCQWSWEGDLRAVGGEKSADDVLTFPDYPNAFERIVGGLDSKNSGHVWVTARPGYEFRLSQTSIHLGGGSHGSLHVLDSVSPLLVAGAPDNIELPAHPRTVDITPLCLNILGLEPKYPLGVSHVSSKPSKK